MTDSGFFPGIGRFLARFFRDSDGLSRLSVNLEVVAVAGSRTGCGEGWGAISIRNSGHNAFCCIKSMLLGLWAWEITTGSFGFSKEDKTWEVFSFKGEFSVMYLRLSVEFEAIKRLVLSPSDGMKWEPPTAPAGGIFAGARGFARLSNP